MKKQPLSELTPTKVVGDTRLQNSDTVVHCMSFSWECVPRTHFPSDPEQISLRVSPGKNIIHKVDAGIMSQLS